VHAWPALGWLLVLALTSQVLGWLLITTSMPRIPAWMIGVILLLQPTGSVTLGYVVLAERPSGVQLGGVALMLAGVFLAVRRSAGKAAQDEQHPPGAGRVDGQVNVEVAVAGHDREGAG
jgi:drug/metabolite transporter (DMT)-like permease